MNTEPTDKCRVKVKGLLIVVVILFAFALMRVEQAFMNTEGRLGTIEASLDIQHD